MTRSTRPVRVLHVFARMDRGGAETWIMNVYRNIDRSRFQFDFAVESEAPGAFDEEIRALGGEVYPLGSPRRLPSYIARFRHLLRERGPYDAVHSHVHHFSGVPLAIARVEGVPVRIAHSHSDTSNQQRQASLTRRAYFRTMKWMIRQSMTTGLGVSQDATAALFGRAWANDARISVLHCGIDLAAFTPPDPNLRASLGIPDEAFVVGHVGRFAPVKNHEFIVELARVLTKTEDNIYFLLVGDGELRSVIAQRVEDLGLSDRVMFAGIRTDVPQLMRGAMNVVILPSLYEGLGLVTVEAQAAGTPAVISGVVPKEADVVPGLVTRMGVHAGVGGWAKAITEVATRRICAGEALDAIAKSPYNIERSVAGLSAQYCGSISRCEPRET